MRRLVCLALWCGLVASSTAAASDPVQQYRSLTPAASGVAVSNTSLVIGRITFEVHAGTFWPLLDPLGEPNGALFEGHGTYRYRCTDPNDLVVFPGNVDRVAKNFPHSDAATWDDFARFALIGVSPALEVLSRTEPTVALTDSAARYYQQFWKGVELDQRGPDFAIAQVRRNGRGEYVFSEIDGGRMRVGYEYDAVRDYAETLTTFRKFPGIELRFWNEVSRQAIADSAMNPPRDFSLVHGNFTIDTVDNKSGTVRSSLRLRIEQDHMRVLVFSLLSNRDPKTARWDSDKKALRVTRVVDPAGRELEFSHRYGQLLVELEKPLARGQELELTFETEGDFFTGPDGKRYDDYFDLFSIDWFPQPRQSGATRMTFELSIATRAPFLLVASGDTVSRREEAGRYFLETRSDTPVWLLAVYAGKFQTATATVGDLTVNVFDYDVAREGDLQALARKAGAFDAIYASRFGPYPFKELDIVGVNHYSLYGISPTGLIVLTQPTTQGNYTAGWHGVNALIAHEVAHQWFGHRAWPANGYYDNWLNESFAEYASGLAMGRVLQTLGADPVLFLDFREMISQWRGAADFISDLGTIQGANLIHGEIGWIQRVNQLYNRGPLVLHMLRTMIGEERFGTVLAQYLARSGIGPTSTDEFSAVLSSVMGEDWSWFVQQWIREPGIPHVMFGHKLERRGGSWVLRLVLQQSRRPFKRLVIPVVLESPSGSRSIMLVHMDQPALRTEIALEEKPSNVLIDPAENNLATYERSLSLLRKGPAGS